LFVDILLFNTAIHKETKKTKPLMQREIPPGHEGNGIWHMHKLLPLKQALQYRLRRFRVYPWDKQYGL
jgi:hypothetical protein